MSSPILVAAAIIVKEGKVLIARRKAGKSLAGFWEFPGGKLEPFESPEQCLERELREELSINVKVSGFLGENTHQYPTFQIRLLAYWCNFIVGVITPVDHDRIAWVIASDLGKWKLAPADVPLVLLIQDALR